jgi:hypothetical protein
MAENRQELIRQLRREKGLPDEPDPLPTTTARLETALRQRLAPYVLGVALLGGGGVAVRQGALDVILRADSTKPDGDKAALAHRVKNIERQVQWLVRQEVRRQVREGGVIADPPEDVE